MRSHLLREPRLDDAQQSQRCQRAEAVDLDQLPDQTHAEDALQRRDPNEVRQAQTLWEDGPHAVIGKVTYIFRTHTSCIVLIMVLLIGCLFIYSVFA